MTTGPCRFEPSLPCSGPFTLSVGGCNDECRGPVDLSKDENRGGKYPAREALRTATKPAAPETREEVMPVAQGVKGSSNIGMCDRCKKDGRKIGTSKHAPGKRLCVSCYVRAYKLSLQGRSLDEAGKDRVPRGESAKTPAPAPAKPKAPSKPKARPTPPVPPPATPCPDPLRPRRNPHRDRRAPGVFAPDSGRHHGAGVDGFAASGAVDGGC